MNYTYMVRCADGTLYTGWTTDVEARVRCHNRKRSKIYQAPPAGRVGVL